MNEDLRARASEAVASSRASEDPDYPRFHVAPPVGRLNDPNGLVHRDGVYHAFFQFAPQYPQRRLIYWGHASSPDLTRWTHHGVAIIPDSWYDRNGAYSGGAVTVGDEVLFHYTGNVKGEQGRESYQCLVTSSDLETFTKCADNPLISGPPLGYTAHIRDPQVWRDADGSYRMLLGAQREDLTGCVLLFRSHDLRAWVFEGEMTFPDAGGRFDRFGYMWECPNLIRVPDADGVRVHDVLIISPQGIGPQPDGFSNVFACGYLVGRLEGNALRDTGEFLELDRGFEFYAPQVFADATGPAGGPLLMAWLGNADEDHQPSMEQGWVHALSVARELVVVDGRLRQRPIVDASAGVAVPLEPPRAVGEPGAAWQVLSGSRSFWLSLALDADVSARWRLRLGSEASHVDLLAEGGSLIVDRSTTRYPHGDRRSVPLPAGAPLRVEVLHDRSVTEVFLGDGAIAFSLRSFLADGADVSLAAAGDVRVVDSSAVRFD